MSNPNTNHQNVPSFDGSLGAVTDSTTGRAWLRFFASGVTRIWNVVIDKTLTVKGTVTVGNAVINASSPDNTAGDPAAITDTTTGRAWAVFHSNGTVTLRLANDSVIPAALTASSEVVSARGTRSDLNSRLSSSLNSYGFPKGYSALEGSLRWTRMLTRKLALNDANTQFDIVLIGDSYTQSRIRWAGPFWTSLKTLYGDAGIGWVGFSYPTGSPGLQNGSVRSDTTVVTTGTWTTNYYGQYSPDLGEITSSTVGDQIVMTFPAGQTSAKLYYKTTAGATLNATFTGVGTQNVDLSQTGNGANGLGIVTLTAPLSSSTTLTLVVTAGTVTICGVDIRNGANGIRVHKIAATGSSAQQWSNVNAAAWQAGITSLKPQLVIILHGTNDQSGSTTPTNFATYIQSIKTNVDTALGATAFDSLIVMPAENQRGLATTMASYSAAVQPVAENTKSAFIDTQPLFGDSPADYAFGSARPWYAADQIHPDPNTGGRVICDAVLRVLLDK